MLILGVYINMSYTAKDLENQVRGDTWYFTFIARDASNASLDITGNEYWFTLKASQDDTDANAAIQLGPFIPEYADAIQGKINVIVQPDVTTVAPQSYYYDLQEVTPGGKVTTLLLGKIKVVKDVTRSTGFVGNSTVLPEPIGIKVGELTKDMTGFVSRDTSTLSFTSDATSATVTFTPVSDTYVYYRGNEFILTNSLSVSLDVNTLGGRYIRFDPVSEALVEVIGHPSILDDTLVAYVYLSYDAVDGYYAVIFGDERHSAERDTTWHRYQHLNVGALLRNGGTASATLLDQDILSMYVADATIMDEDLEHVITHSATPSNPYEQILRNEADLEVLYYGQNNAYEVFSGNSPLNPWAVNGRAYYNAIDGNGLGSLELAANGGFVAYWLVATNDSRSPMKLVMGTSSYATEKDALAETFIDFATPLPFPEMVPLYRIVLETKDNYTNGVVIVALQQLDNTLSSWENSTSVNSHSELTDLNASDSHPISAITGLQAALDGKVDDSQVLTNVPENALFTDTVYDDTALASRVSALENATVSRSIGIIAVEKSTTIVDGTDILGAIEVPYDAVITEIRAKTATGTCDVTFNNAGASIGVVSATDLGVSNTTLGNNTMSVWDDLTIDISNASGTGLAITIKFTEA